ncbi:MAG: HAD-IA family hydrolase [Planctomycetota bacterium]|jgi:HAD superfamily hydrolase (TIGR01509 family)|nr:HAD-IA family hydrolase [Planctomycetota bacterium]
MIKAIIFDMDGCLADTEPIIAAASILGLAEYGVSAKAEDFVPFVGRGDDLFVGGVAEKYGVPYKVEMKERVYQIYLEIVARDGKPFPGVPALLAAIHARGVPMAVGSSADKVKVEANIGCLGVPREWFPVVVDGTMAPKKKPAPDLFLIAANLLGLAPAECAVVEDAVHGIEAARAAGMRAVGVANTLPAAELEAAGADVVKPATGDVTLADLGLEA